MTTTALTGSWIYAGRDGKAYLLTDGVRTLHLTAKEFRAFPRG